MRSASSRSSSSPVSGPYAAETPVTEAFAHLNAPIPSAAQIAPALPRGVDAVFQRALAKEPDARPASAGELVAELDDVFRDAEPTTAVLPRAQRTSAPPATATGGAGGSSRSRCSFSRSAGSPPRRSSRTTDEPHVRHDHARDDDGVDRLRHGVDSHRHRDGDRSGRGDDPGSARARAVPSSTTRASRGCRQRTTRARSRCSSRPSRSSRARDRWQRLTRATTSRSPVRARELRRRARAPRPLRRGAGRPIRDRAAPARGGEGSAATGRRKGKGEERGRRLAQQRDDLRRPRGSGPWPASRRRAARPRGRRTATSHPV